MRRATLYAYTSRGQLQSERVPGEPRERRYHREDIERLVQRKEARRDPAKAAERGLHWGSPVLPSSITLIQNGKLYYRGQDAVKLAETATLGQIAGLLWEWTWESPPMLPATAFRQVRTSRGRTAAKNDCPTIAFQTALPIAGADDPAAYDLRPEAVRRAGARILRLLTMIAAGRQTNEEAHQALQSAWAPRNPSAAEAIRTALVLCADHELNVSAFTARCAASAGASPYDVVAAALASVKGLRHGGETERVQALFAEVGSPRRAEAVVASRLRRGERIPGFGHPLYPGGDPRAVVLLRFAERGSNRGGWNLTRGIARAGEKLLHEHANVDFALAALACTWDLPAYAPIVLFALGRTAGWIAHAMEQYGSGELIRPRAKYQGIMP